MVYIADENGDPIWDEALDPIDDGTVAGTFVSGGKVVFVKPVQQAFYAEKTRQTFFAKPIEQTFYARPI